VITFPLLGYWGRLGNQMFQYAALMGFAKKHDYEFGICFNHANVYGGFANHKERLQLLDCFELSCEDTKGGLHETTLEEVSVEHDLPDNINLHGYYQSEKYFKHIENEIRQEFFFKKEIREKAAAILPQDVCVSVHVRRGDYVNLSHIHTNLGAEYYKNSLDHFEGYKPVFISDDIEWCKDEFSNIQDAVFVESESEYVDMCVMTMCNAHVIANSSFSWWGSWLGQGETIAPKQWFTGEQGPTEWEDVYCEGWIKK